jgi:ketosteroid isomerase-like protein
MGTIPKPDDDSTSSSIDAIRQAWLDAIRAADVERLAALVTDDVVVVPWFTRPRAVCGDETN